MTPTTRTLSLLAALTTVPVMAQWVPYDHPNYNSIYSVTTGPGAIYMVSYPNGVIKSTDGGSVWNPANTGFASVSTVESVFYNGTTLFSGTHNGVYRSTDAGASWSLANTGLPASSGTNFVNKFFKSGTTTFAVYSAAISAGGGVWRTTDNGDNWFSGNSGLSTNMTVYQIAQIGSSLYAATSTGLCYSTDLGITWNGIPTANFSVFAVQGTPGRIVIISSFGYRYSTNGGGNWTNATGAPANPSGGELILYDGSYWAITGSSPSDVLRSTDNGASYSLYETGLVGADAIAQYEFHASGTTLYLGTLTKLYSHPGTTLGMEDGAITEWPKPYPTLFVDAFTVDLSSQAPGSSMVLIDATGREVAQRKGLPAAPVRFDRGDLPAGTYRVMLVDPSKGTHHVLGPVIAQ